MLNRLFYIFFFLSVLILLLCIRRYSSDYVLLRQEYVRNIDQNMQNRYYARLADHFDQRYKEFVAQQSLAQLVDAEITSNVVTDKKLTKSKRSIRKKNQKKVPVSIFSKNQRRSISRQGFLWPVERSNFWLSSRFGPRKKEDGSWGYHYGLDMAAPRGTPVMAASGGVIIEAGFSTRGYGKTIVIRHNHGGYETRYAHLHAIFVRVGQRVISGNRIGSVGDTGYVRGENGGKNAYHLHFEVKKNGKYVDPLCVLA